MGTSKVATETSLCARYCCTKERSLGGLWKLGICWDQLKSTRKRANKMHPGISPKDLGSLRAHSHISLSSLTSYDIFCLPLKQPSRSTSLENKHTNRWGESGNQNLSTASAKPNIQKNIPLVSSLTCPQKELGFQEHGDEQNVPPSSDVIPVDFGIFQRLQNHVRFPHLNHKEATTLSCLMVRLTTGQPTKGYAFWWRLCVKTCENHICPCNSFFRAH